jgi:hypothetical protein
MNKNINVVEMSIVSTDEALNNAVQAKKFHKLWDCLTGTVAFMKEWHNGTGYMNGACTDPFVKDLAPGAYKATADDGRKLIIAVSKEREIVVLFERYTDGSKIVANKSWYLNSGNAAAIAALGYAVDDHTNPLWDVEAVINYVVK